MHCRKQLSQYCPAKPDPALFLAACCKISTFPPESLPLKRKKPQKTRAKTFDKVRSSSACAVLALFWCFGLVLALFWPCLRRLCKNFANTAQKQTAKKGGCRKFCTRPFFSLSKECERLPQKSNIFRDFSKKPNKFNCVSLENKFVFLFDQLSPYWKHTGFPVPQDRIS